jgi:hypothetical protein
MMIIERVDQFLTSDFFRQPGGVEDDEFALVALAANVALAQPGPGPGQ